MRIKTKFCPSCNKITAWTNDKAIIMYCIECGTEDKKEKNTDSFESIYIPKAPGDKRN